MEWIFRVLDPIGRHPTAYEPTVHILNLESQKILSNYFILEFYLYNLFFGSRSFVYLYFRKVKVRLCWPLYTF